jgi:predicted TIM-barrel enzyme
MGLTTGGSIGARTSKTLEDCVVEVQAIADACKSARSDCLVLCHGGPIASPEDAQLILHRCRGVDGFYGASSMERLPAETAVAEHVRRFTKMRLAGGRPGSS